MTQILFQNRTEAGKKLADKVKKLNPKNPVVLALTNGGVVVGGQIAQTLNCPLEPIVTRKIFYPKENSLGFGAINNRGKIYLSEYAEGLPAEIIEHQSRLAKKVLTRKLKTFRKFLKSQSLVNKTVVLVDDSSATGSSMMSAIASLVKRNPKKVIIALTICTEQARKLLMKNSDKIITLYLHPASSFQRASIVYRNYSKISNQKTLQILEEYVIK